jgi:hypothetical protein
LQLAYGHHRWFALQELGIEEIDVPVRDIDDATMLRIMAEENLDWSTSPAVVIQTVQVAKEYLDAELAKEWKDSDKSVRVLFDSEHAYNQARRKEGGVGKPTILKFLGGNWKHWVVRYATEILGDKSINREAVNIIPTMRQAKSFKESVKKHSTPKPAQKEIAETIAKEGVGFRDIPDLVAEHAPPTVPGKRESPKRKPLPNIIEFVNTCETDTDSLNRRLKALRPELEELVKKGRLMSRLVSALRQLGKTASAVVEEYDKQKKRKESVICQKDR